MFGYVNPDREYLFIKDEELYKALYCGMCKSIGKGCGNFSKTALTYDMAFMSALMHNVANCDVHIKKRRCALHLIKRRYMADPDEISIILGCINTALAYHKLLDDRRDGDKKGLFAFMYRHGYKRTLKKHPEVAKIVGECMAAQQALEKKNTAVIEEAAEPTAVMMQKLSRYVLKDFSTPYTDALTFAIGKWVYLADALDDYDKDVKRGRFNVFYNAYLKPSRAEAVKANAAEINFLFDSLFAAMRNSLVNIKFYYNHDLTDNIILRGIPLKTRRLVYGTCAGGNLNDEQTQP